MCYNKYVRDEHDDGFVYGNPEEGESLSLNLSLECMDREAVSQCACGCIITCFAHDPI